MSILFGPLSDTMSSVSWRDCALAGDQIAGAAGSALPAASAVAVLGAAQSAWHARFSFRSCACPARNQACADCVSLSALPGSAGRKVDMTPQVGGGCDAKPTVWHGHC